MKLMRGHWAWNLFLLLLVAGIFYAIALPNRIRRGTSTKNTCISHLKQIDGAIQQWALDNKRAETTAPDLSAAMKYLKDGKLLKCPSGGSYAAGRTVADAPTCTKGKELGHTLP
jgi:competence protein ComGC